MGLLALVAIYMVALFSSRVQEQEKQEERLLAELEESRKTGLRAAALAERQRLARDMHDVLAHSLSGLVVQLEGTRLLAATVPGDDRLPAPSTGLTCSPAAASTRRATRSECSAATNCPARGSWRS